MRLPVELLGDVVKRGAILHSTDFKDIDHGKFFVIIGVSENYVAGFFFINSRIHPSIMNKREQLDMQYPLKAKDYNFLRYDSFLSASNLIKKSKYDIINSFSKGLTKFVDTLNHDDLQNVLGMARNSRLYSKKEKEMFFY